MNMPRTTAQQTVQEPAPLSPARPAAWTDAVHEAAKLHTEEVFPNEAVGIVTGGEYVRLHNASHEPERDVYLSDEDLLRVAGADVFFHSHPNGIGSPSETDMVYQLQLGIPFVVMCWPFYDCFWWGDTLQPMPLLGRGFRHGVHDCYSLIKDYFREQGVALMEGPRDWEWWSKGQDLYTANFAKAGFERIDQQDAVMAGDVLLMAFNYKVPMHGAIVYNRDLIMHHPAAFRPVDPTHLSTLTPRVRFQRHIHSALRYRP